jgi:hypothetical protein
LLSGEFKPGDIIVTDIDKNKNLKFTKKKAARRTKKTTKK